MQLSIFCSKTSGNHGHSGSVVYHTPVQLVRFPDSNRFAVLFTGLVSTSHDLFCLRTENQREKITDKTVSKGTGRMKTCRNLHVAGGRQRSKHGFVNITDNNPS